MNGNFILVLLFFVCACNSSSTSNIPVSDSGCNKFDFIDLDKEFWGWYKNPLLAEVDSLSAVKIQSDYPEINIWDNSYQTLYFFCRRTIDDHDAIVIVQRVHNDAESNMYLIFKDKTYTSRCFLLATISKAPDDFLRVNSYMKDDNSIVRLKLYEYSDETESYKDSISSVYSLKNGSFARIFYDSIRVAR